MATIDAGAIHSAFTLLSVVMRLDKGEFVPNDELQHALDEAEFLAGELEGLVASRD